MDFLNTLEKLNKLGRTSTIFRSRSNNKFSRGLKALNGEELFSTFSFMPISIGEYPTEKMPYYGTNHGTHAIVIATEESYLKFYNANILQQNAPHVHHNVHHFNLKENKQWTREFTEAILDLLELATNEKRARDIANHAS